MFVPPNRKNISSNNSINTHHEPANELRGVSLKECPETAAVNKTGLKSDGSEYLLTDAPPR